MSQNSTTLRRTANLNNFIEECVKMHSSDSRFLSTDPEIPTLLQLCFEKITNAELKYILRNLTIDVPQLRIFRIPKPEPEIIFKRRINCSHCFRFLKEYVVNEDKGYYTLESKGYENSTLNFVENIPCCFHNNFILFFKHYENAIVFNLSLPDNIRLPQFLLHLNSIYRNTISFSNYSPSYIELMSVRVNIDPDYYFKVYIKELKRLKFYFIDTGFMKNNFKSCVGMLNFCYTENVDLRHLLLLAGIEPNPGPVMDHVTGADLKEDTKRDKKSRKVFPKGYHTIRLTKEKYSHSKDINKAQRIAQKEIKKSQDNYNTRKQLENIFKQLDVQPQGLTSDLLDHVNEPLADILILIQDFIDNLVDTIPAKYLYRVRLIFKMVLFSQAKSAAHLITLVADTMLAKDTSLIIDNISLFAIGSAIVKIYNFIKSLYGLDEQPPIVAPQAYMSDYSQLFNTTSIISTISALAACAAGLTCVGVLPDKKTIDFFINRCHSIPRAIKSVADCFTYFKQNFTDFIASNFPQLNADINFKTDNIKLQEHSKKILEIISSTTKDGAIFDTAILAETRNLYIEHLSFIKYATETQNFNLKSQLAGFTPMITNAYRTMQNSPASGATFRQEPCCVAITGAPNLGKSALTRILSVHCLKSCGITKEQVESKTPNAFIYNRSTGQPYWTNYDATTHAICVIDDANQIQLAYTEGLPFIGEFISLKNSVPAPLNVAECELKKYAYFNSRLIILSDNDGAPEIDKVIRSVDAYDRRIDFKLICTRIPDIPDDYKNFTHLEITLEYIDLKTKQFYTQPRMTFLQILPMIQNRIAEYNSIFKSSDDDTKDVLDQYYSKEVSDIEPQMHMFSTNKPKPPSRGRQFWNDANAMRKFAHDFKQQSIINNYIVSGLKPPEFQPAPELEPEPLPEDFVFEFAKKIQQEKSHEYIVNPKPSTSSYIHDVAEVRENNKRHTFATLRQLYVTLTLWFSMELNCFKHIMIGSGFSFTSFLFKFRILSLYAYHRFIKRESYMTVLARIMHQNITFITPRNKKIAIVTCATAAFVAVMGYALHEYFKRRKLETHPQSYSNATKIFRKNTPRNRVKVSKTLRGTGVTTQTLVHVDEIPVYTTPESQLIETNISFEKLMKPIKATDSNAEEILDKVKRNVYIMTYSFCGEDDVPKYATNHITVLCGKIAFITWHFVQTLLYYHQENTNYKYETLKVAKPCHKENKDITYNIDIDEFIRLARTWSKEDSFADCALVYLESIPTHADISKYLLNDDEFATFNSTYVKRLTINFTGPKLLHEITTGNTLNKYLPTNTYPLSFDDEKYVLVSEFFLYQAPNANGMCAAPIIAIDPTRSRKLVGFHTGDFGNKSSSVACHITQSVVESYKEHLKKELPLTSSIRAQISFSDEALQALPIPHRVFTNEMVDQVATYQHTAVIPKQSRIYKSPVHGLITPPICFPARLKNFTNSEGEFVDVLKKSVSKQFNTSCIIDAEDLDVAKYEANRLFAEVFGTEKPRLLTHDEIIKGGNIENLNPIPRSTSPGYPYLGQPRKSTGKHPWLGTGDEYVLDNEFLLSEIKKYEDNAEKYLRTIQPYTVQLKDETRDPERVALGKTRTFTASNLTLTYLHRKYFGHIGAKCITQGKYCGMLPGINYHGTDVNIIVDYCKRISPLNLPNFCAGDYTNFDGTLNERILRIILDTWISKMTLSEKDYKIVSMLTLDIYNALLLIDNQIIQNSHSLPSGCSLTTILNTWYNKILAAMTIQRFLRKNHPEKSHEFNKMYGLLAYGDDNIFVISPELRNLIEPRHITEMMTHFGMTYTSGDKNGLISYLPFSEVKILKRAFVFNDYLVRWTMPLELSVILEVLNWDRKDNEHDKLEQLKMNLDFLNLELATHGKSIWTEWMNKAINIIQPLVPNLPYYTYQSALEHTNEDAAKQSPHFHGMIGAAYLGLDGSN